MTHGSSYRRRSPRFLRVGLRTFLLLLTAACVYAGWQTRRARLQRDAVGAISASGGHVYYDYQLRSDNLGGEPPGPAWLRNLIGVDYLADVLWVDYAGKPHQDLAPAAHLPALRTLHAPQASGDLTALAKLAQLRELHLSGAACQDLSPLRRLNSLCILDLSSTPVRDLSPLSRLRRLEVLDLAETQVEDLSPLAGLRQLKSLRLTKTPVRDITPLLQLTALEDLWLEDAPLSDHSLQQLQRALPACRVEVGDVSPQQ